MVLLAAGIPVSGCVLFDDTRRAGPDEFGVVSRAPLSQPPDFSLRPPRAGAKRPNEVTPREDAQKKLLSSSPQPVASVSPAASVPKIVVPAFPGAAGQPARGGIAAANPTVSKEAQPADTISQGELALLQQAGATQVDPKIRTLVDRESGRVREDDSLVDKLVFWRSAKSSGATIDPSGEAERLNRNAALGQPPGGEPKRGDAK
jgi:hypothetical protein